MKDAAIAIAHSYLATPQEAVHRAYSVSCSLYSGILAVACQWTSLRHGWIVSQQSRCKVNETCNAMQSPTRVPSVLYYWISASTGGWHFLWRDAVRLKTLILEVEGFTPQLYGPMGLHFKLLKRALDPLEMSTERSQF